MPKLQGPRKLISRNKGEEEVSADLAYVAAPQVLRGPIGTRAPPRPERQPVQHHLAVAAPEVGRSDAVLEREPARVVEERACGVQCSVFSVHLRLIDFCITQI